MRIWALSWHDRGVIVLIVAAALVVVGLAAALAFGGLARVSVRRTDPVSSAAGRPLPEGEVTSDDVEDLRFDITVRGYRMEQVDAALDRLRLRMAELEEEVAISRLPSLFADDVRADPASPSSSVPTAASPSTCTAVATPASTPSMIPAVTSDAGETPKEADDRGVLRPFVRPYRPSADQTGPEGSTHPSR